MTTAWYGGQQERILDYNPTRYVFPLISSLYAANKKTDGGQERKRHANNPTHSAALRNCHFHAEVTPYSSTRPAHHLLCLASAILMPKLPLTAALVQHSTCFVRLLPFSCRSSPLQQHSFSISICFVGLLLFSCRGYPQQQHSFSTTTVLRRFLRSHAAEAPNCSTRSAHPPQTCQNAKKRNRIICDFFK